MPQQCELRRLNPRRFGAKARREWEQRTADLEAVLDPVRYRGVIRMICFYECQANQVRQVLMEDGALTPDKAVKSLLAECRALDALLLRLYHATGLISTANVRRQDFKDGAGDLTKLFKDVGHAKAGGKETDQPDQDNALEGATDAPTGTTDAIPDTKQTRDGDCNAE